MILVLTGEKGAGKSTLLMRFAYSIKKPRGVVSMRSKTGGFEATLLPSFDRLELAEEIDAPEGGTAKFCSYFFRNAALSKANETIANVKDGETLIVDEVGFWELEGGGYAPNFGIIAGRASPTVLSIRKTP
jgi:nucleoside-triphosphatase THEP1